MSGGFQSNCCCKPSIRDLQKQTQNFTTLLEKGSYGRVYKATMATGEAFAVEVLPSNSNQGEQEFQTELQSPCVASFLLPCDSCYRPEFHRPRLPKPKLHSDMTFEQLARLIVQTVKTEP